MASWRYDPDSGPRDLRLDLLRGFCLLKMVFNHLWPTPLHAAQAWIGWVSAAEGFFFISGAVAAIVYGRRAEQDGMAHAGASLARRGLHLYVSNLSLVFLFFAFELTRLLPTSFRWNEGFSWPDLFRFDQPYFLQMLPRYSVYLLLAPAGLWCLRHGKTAWLLAACSSLHAANLLLDGSLRLPFFEPGPAGGFQVVAWQLLFFTGMAVGHHRQRIGARWRALPAWAGVGLPCALFLGFVLFEKAMTLGWISLHPHLIWELFNREHLGPARLLNLAAAFACFFVLADRFWHPLARFLGPLLLPFGQSALYVFLVHILLNGLRLIAEPHLPFELFGHPWRLIAANLALVGLHWAMVRYRVLAAVIPR